MIMHKIPISGIVTRIEPGRIFVRRGEVTEMYNPEYYRIVSQESEKKPPSRAAKPN